MNGIIEAIVVILGMLVLMLIAATPVIMFFKGIDMLDNWEDEE